MVTWRVKKGIEVRQEKRSVGRAKKTPCKKAPVENARQERGRKKNNYTTRESPVHLYYRGSDPLFFPPPERKKGGWVGKKRVFVSVQSKM